MGNRQAETQPMGNRQPETQLGNRQADMPEIDDDADDIEAPRGSGRAAVAREDHGRAAAAREDHGRPGGQLSPGSEDDDAPAGAWGSDDEPAQPITLAADLPAEPPADDPDPLTYDAAGGQLGEDVANVLGVRFVSAGRIQWCSAGDGDYVVGDRVIVDSDRGQRLATVAVGVQRRSGRARELRRVIRRANAHDLGSERAGDDEAQAILRAAKDVVAKLGLPLKASRVERSGGRVLLYYTSDEQRLDLRDFVSQLASAARGSRLELRQLGARDEAKVIGGIGSCGLTLCCTTWLPEFVPVSIKMAKDQGLVLSPTKVAGQCGRLKCCLVYEQAAYAELRKGLPKLGKRVVTQRGEGRIVEVDVLRQRVRVGYGPGDSEVLPAGDVKPMFPAQRPDQEPEAEPEPEEGV